MSEDVKHTDIESDVEKRTHHNALERKRRDRMKNSFSSLRDSIPTLQGKKVVSMTKILKNAAEYITFMQREISSYQTDMDDLKRQNNLLEVQICILEKAILTENSAIDNCDVKQESDVKSYNDSKSKLSDSKIGRTVRRPKRLKMSVFSTDRSSMKPSHKEKKGDGALSAKLRETPITRVKTCDSSGVLYHK